jgi:MFS family permease
MADLAGERFLARASSVFFACAFLGAGLAVVGGGAIVDYFDSSATIVGWRAALILGGAPGLLGAAYLSLFPWQETAARRPNQPGNGPAVTAALIAAALLSVTAQIVWRPEFGVPVGVLLAVAATLIWLRRLRRDDNAAYRATLGQAQFRWLLLTFAAVLFVDFAAAFWLIPFAQRQFGVSAGVAGAQLGALMIGGGIVGSLLGGALADRWNRVSTTGRVWTAFLAVLGEIAAILLALQQSHYAVFVPAFGAFCVASGAWTGVVAALGLDMLPRPHRGTGVAAYFLVTTVLGPGLGPFVAGMLAENFGSVGRALTWCCAVIAVASVGFFRLLSYQRRTGRGLASE